MKTAIKEFEAIYEEGILRPLEPLSLPENQRLRVTVHTKEAILDELIDHEFMEACALEADDSVSLDQVRAITSKITGSLSKTVISERNER